MSLFAKIQRAFFLPHSVAGWLSCYSIQQTFKRCLVLGIEKWYFFAKSFTQPLLNALKTRSKMIK